MAICYTTVGVAKRWRLALERGGDIYVYNGNFGAFGVDCGCCVRYIFHHKKEINRRAWKTCGLF